MHAALQRRICRTVPVSIPVDNMHSVGALPAPTGTARVPLSRDLHLRTCSPCCTTWTTPRPASTAGRRGSARQYSTHAVAEKYSKMMHPPGPSILYPECKFVLDGMFDSWREYEEQMVREGVAAGYASGAPEAVIETPPEWGAPDEGNPNQPRRVPEYQPPQEPVPGGPSTPEFVPPERTRPSPPVPQDDPMRPLPPEQPEIPPNERDPLKKAPEQMPDSQPARRGDEQTQPQPGEASASLEMSEEEAAEQMELQYLQWCRDEHSIEDLVDVYLNDSDQPMIELTHPSGSTAQILMHGAHVSSWTNPEGAELLHVQQQQSGPARRAGMTPCFPNFGAHHALPTNGFLQDCEWSLVHSDRSGPLGWDPAPEVTLYAESDEETLKVWPHHFQAAYTIQLMVPDDFPSMDLPNTYHAPRPKDPFGSVADMNLGSDGNEEEVQPTMQLRLELRIQNTGDKEMTFTTALQSHLATQNLTKPPRFTKMLGLGGKHFLNFRRDPLQPILGLETEDYVTFGVHDLHRVYTDSDRGTIKFCPGNQTHFEVLQRQGFQDLGVTNRRTAVEQRTAEYSQQVVLSPAQFARPVTLAPEETWIGEVALRWHDKSWDLPLFERGPQPGGISDQIMPGYDELDRERQMPPLPRQKRQAAKASMV